MIAFEISGRWPARDIVVFEEGPDPRSLSDLWHRFGATYSGLDARHVSLTETGPWTSHERLPLMHRRSADGGWNCLTDVQLTAGEEHWLQEFIATAEQPALHAANYNIVADLNREGLDAWRCLSAMHPELFSPTETSGCLHIVCANSDDLANEQRAEHELDPENVSSPYQSLPDSLAPLERQFSAGVLYGSFTVAGMAYRVKTLCVRLITHLETVGVIFNWNHRANWDTDDYSLLGADEIWAGGVSTTTSAFLADNGVLLQGVAGCWIALPNPGLTESFKIFGPEPVNFINATPVGPMVLLSGGYGWMGQRPYPEVEALARPLRVKFEESVARFFCKAGESLPQDLPRGLCLRPSLPSGVPEIRMLSRTGDLRRILCVGHAAGGFTQAPAVAKQVAMHLEG
jgi:hypothetical protein